MPQPYQEWFQLAKWFQRKRLKCKSLQTTQTVTMTDDGRQVMAIPQMTLWVR